MTREEAREAVKIFTDAATEGGALTSYAVVLIPDGNTNTNELFQATGEPLRLSLLLAEEISRLLQVAEAPPHVLDFVERLRVTLGKALVRPGCTCAACLARGAGAHRIEGGGRIERNLQN